MCRLVGWFTCEWQECFTRKKTIGSVKPNSRAVSSPMNKAGFLWTSCVCSCPCQLQMEPMEIVTSIIIRCIKHDFFPLFSF